jgi:hypothetical protein
MRTLLISLTVVIHAVSGVLAQPAPRSSVEEARADFEAGDYRGCLKKVSALLPSRIKRDATERYDLLMLRGECLMRLKQRAAADAFDAAAAAMKDRRDLPRAAQATSLAVLVKASPDFKYRQRGRSEGSGIDIIDPSSRPRAMEALFQDLSSQVAPGLDKALQDESLVSTDRLLRDVWHLYTVELAATGDTASTAEKLQALGDHVRTLIGTELNRLNTRLEQLRDLADEPTWTSEAMGYRGLNTDERGELRQVADYLVRIQRTVENGRRISRALGKTGENWDALLADCAVARDVAQQAYDRRY